MVAKRNIITKHRCVPKIHTNYRKLNNRKAAFTNAQKKSNPNYCYDNSKTKYKKLVNKTVNGSNKKHPITFGLNSCNAINAVPLHCVILKRVSLFS